MKLLINNEEISDLSAGLHQTIQRYSKSLFKLELKDYRGDLSNELIGLKNLLEVSFESCVIGMLCLPSSLDHLDIRECQIGSFRGLTNSKTVSFSIVEFTGSFSLPDSLQSFFSYNTDLHKCEGFPRYVDDISISSEIIQSIPSFWQSFVKSVGSFAVSEIELPIEFYPVCSDLTMCYSRSFPKGFEIGGKFDNVSIQYFGCIDDHIGRLQTQEIAFVETQIGPKGLIKISEGGAKRVSLDVYIGLSFPNLKLSCLEWLSIGSTVKPIEVSFDFLPSSLKKIDCREAGYHIEFVNDRVNKVCNTSGVIEVLTSETFLLG